MSFEVDLRWMDRQAEQTAVSVVKQDGPELAVDPDWKVIETFAVPSGDCDVKSLVKTETDRIPARRSFVEPRTEIGGKELGEKSFDGIGHGVLLSLAGGFAAF
jgi:hypothetical protein